jgi:hypothetical protein
LSGAPDNINRNLKPGSMTEAARATPPAADETEIGLLGPGFGECLVVHVGQGRWVIVDSCLGDDGKTPAALDYLEKLGVDPAKAVTHFVVTHADNDHIGGAPVVFEACKTATLVLSQALTDRDVLAWIATYSHVDPTSLARASTNIAALIENVDKDRLRFGIEDRPLFDEAYGKLTALSPSDEKIKAFVSAVAAQLPKAGAPRRRVLELSPNQASMALLLETPACIAILGADLEEKPGQGWTRIANHSIAYRNAGKALVIKVAHHGSPNAHCEAIADLFLGLNEGLGLEVPLEELTLDRRQACDGHAVWCGIVHEGEHVEDGGTSAYGLRQCEHQARHETEEHALLGGQVGADEARKQIIECLDDARCDLFPGLFVVCSEPIAVHIENIERRGMLDVSRTYGLSYLFYGGTWWPEGVPPNPVPFDPNVVGSGPLL